MDTPAVAFHRGASTYYRESLCLFIISYCRLSIHDSKTYQAGAPIVFHIPYASMPPGTYVSLKGIPFIHIFLDDFTILHTSRLPVKE